MKTFVRKRAVVSVSWFALAALCGCLGAPTGIASDKIEDGESTLALCHGDAPDGKSCVGWTAAEKRGWSGFCVAGTCTEYVAVRCHVTTPSDETVVGCDGSGEVTNGYTIEFGPVGKAQRCDGTEGEFGYCATGELCVVDASRNGGARSVGVCEM